MRNIDSSWRFIIELGTNNYEHYRKVQATMTKMNLYEYLSLSDQEQYDLAMQRGEFLDCYIQGDTRFALYALDMFFVEIEYDNSQNKIKGKGAFVTGELLDKYTML